MAGLGEEEMQDLHRTSRDNTTYAARLLESIKQRSIGNWYPQTRAYEMNESSPGNKKQILI